MLVLQDFRAGLQATIKKAVRRDDRNKNKQVAEIEFEVKYEKN